MRSCLITGAAGLVGSHLAEKLGEDYTLFPLSRNGDAPYGTPITADLSDSGFIEELPEKMDCIVHLAQSEHFREFPEKAEDIFSVNTHSTFKLLEYARKAGVKTFVYASSGAVYENGDDAASENAPLPVKEGRPGLYYASKLCSELLAWEYQSLFNVIILRFFFVYGQGQKPHMLVPRLIDSVCNEKEILLQGPEGIKINPIHASDAAEAVAASLNLNESHKINVAGTEILSIRQMAEIIGKEFEKEPQFKIQDARPAHLVADTQKMGNLLCTPQTSFVEGIRKSFALIQK